MLSLLAFVRAYWQPLVGVAVVLALLIVGAASWQALQRSQQDQRVQTTLATQALHQAQAAELRRRTDSAAAYEAGRLTELRRQANLLAHADETLTARRPAAVRLPAHPPRE